MGFFEDAFDEIEKVMMEGVESDLEEYNISALYEFRSEVERSFY